MDVLNGVVLALLVIQSVIGVFALVRWRSALRANTHFPIGVVTTHIVVVDLATICWITRVAVDELAWGWVALVVVLIGNGMGDLVLAGRWRLDQALAGQWFRGWVDAAKGLLNPKRRLGAAHAVGAGVTTVMLLIACIAAI